MIVARLIYATLGNGTRTHLLTVKPDLDVEGWAQSRSGSTTGITYQDLEQ